MYCRKLLPRTVEARIDILFSAFLTLELMEREKNSKVRYLTLISILI